VWLVSNKYDRDGARLADGHYSRRTPGSPQFMPPGETIVLVVPGGVAVFGWWRPDPFACTRLGMRATSGLDGWTCSIFRNPEGTSLRSSDLVLAAERHLADAEARGDTHGPCGPDGMLSWVWPRKLKPRPGVEHSNPGWCFQVAGWTRDRWSSPSVGKGRMKRLLRKPIRLAGVPACDWRPREPIPFVLSAPCPELVCLG